MKKLMKHRIVLIIALLAVTITAQADKKQDEYKAFAESIRKEIWALKLPEFEQTTVPDRYKDRSAVILAAHSRLEVTKKTRLSIGSFLLNSGLTNREVTCRNLYRELVAIQDKASLERYSEFDFKAETKHKEWQYDELTQRVLGVRIIKPDGTVSTVDTDEFMTTTEGKKGDEQRQKLAVPGLEIGDKIDIFFFTLTNLENHNLPPFTFAFRHEYPMLSYTVHCELDKGLTTQYRTLNGAPDFRQSTNEEKDIILDAEVKDVADVEPSLWYNPVRQTPYIRMHVINPKMKYGYIPESARKNTGLQANPDVSPIIRDNHYGYWAGNAALACGLTTREIFHLRGLVKDLKKMNLTDEQKADSAMTYLNMGVEASPQGEYDSARFFALFRYFLDLLDIEYQALVTVRNDEKEPMEQRIDAYLMVRGVELAKSKKIYIAPTLQGQRRVSSLLTPLDIPAEVQGEKFYYLQPQIEKTYTRTGTVPLSTMDDNKNLTTLQVTLQGTEAEICRNELYTGHLKQFYQTHLVKISDRYAVARPYLKLKGTAAEQLGKKEQADFAEWMRQADEREKTDYANEVEGYHGEKPKAVTSYRMKSIGLHPQSRNLEYEVKYTMDGLVKKAGPNYVLSAGKLLGSQMKVEGRERTRTFDVHATAPRTYQWHVSVTLPEGYTVKPDNLKKLNVKVENECASFTAHARLEAGKLVIEAAKNYFHREEPAANFGKLLEVVDAAVAYEAASVVLSRQ